MTDSPNEECHSFDQSDHDNCYSKVRVDFLSGSSPEQILARWKNVIWTDELVEHCLDEVQRELKVIIVWPDPKTWDGREQKWNWYPGPEPSSMRWHHYVATLRKSGHLAEETLKELESSTTRILNLCPPPSRGTFQSRALVMGHVQSGKTTNFLGLAAKAADENYRLIIILSGMTNNLRDQTQSRLQSMVKGFEPGWHLLTQDKIDFRANIGNAQQLCSNNALTLVAVVKKNSSRLKALHTWLSKVDHTTRMALPVLIVDDESDQATTNAGSAEKRNAINLRLANLMDPNFLPKVSYVGYTATPFANILADTSDLNSTYPKDFIVSLTKSEGYFGAHELFGTEVADDAESEGYSGVDIIRDIPDNDVKSVVPPRQKAAVAGWKPAIPETLDTAIKWFILATAARKARGHKNFWSTMMVHTSSNIEPHRRTAAAVIDHLKLLEAKDRNVLGAELKQLWDLESPVAAELEKDETRNWPDVHAKVDEVLSTLKVFIDNSESLDRLNYLDDDIERHPVILVGGNTLSRGLTLEGLISSYFLRTSNAYDSLMQMGRWFGYRPGYSDLQRIWMANEKPYETKYWFRELALVEQEIRDQIEIYASDGLSPLQLGVRIKSLPGMAITARAKNKGDKVQIGYGKTRQQTILFDSDSSKQASNLGLVSELVNDVQKEVGWGTNINGWPVATEVDVKLVEKFISKYTVHENVRTLESSKLLNYIEKLKNEGELKKWNIVLYSNRKKAAQTYKVTDQISIKLANRSRMDEETINIKALISLKDMIADKPQILKNDINGGGKITEAALWKLRKEEPDLVEKGLLGIYIIDKDSAPNSPLRVTLGTTHHLVGYFLVFPETESKHNVSYEAPNLTQVAEAIEVDIDDPFANEAEEEADAMQPLENQP